MGIDRKVKRNALKNQYAKFAVSWKKEKAYQKYVLEELKQELPEGQPRLAGKPTFNQWCKMMENLKHKLALQNQAKTAVASSDPVDLEWKED